MALSPLQERVAALVATLPESEGFVLAGGAAMAAHGVLDRITRDLDYFAGPEDAAAVRRMADAFEDAASRRGLDPRREREGPSFVRFSVSDGREQSEVDFAIDYRALEPVATRYGPALDLRELAANKVLAIFARAEPRDFVDLEQLTRRFPLDELVALAADKDPGLDLDVLDSFMARVGSIPRAEFELDDRGHERCSPPSMAGAPSSSACENSSSRATAPGASPTGTSAWIVDRCGDGLGKASSRGVLCPTLIAA